MNFRPSKAWYSYPAKKGTLNQVVRFDELSVDEDNSRMSATTVDVAIVQKCYPQIYLACHTRHRRAASTEHHLSERDSPLLSHLNMTVPISHGELATHLGVRPSTLSAAISKLEKLGYVERGQEVKDRRMVMLRLTQKGAAARAATSVLDYDRVAAILSMLSKKDKTLALTGLEILANASRDFMRQSGRGMPRHGEMT